MNSSPTITNLAKAMSQFQGEVDSATKDGKNPHFKSKFATLLSYQNAAGPLLAKLGLSVMQGSDGINLTTRLSHSSGEWIESAFPMMPVKNDPQSQGSAITYLRRYSYAAILGMVAEDDDGETAHGRIPEKKELANKPATKVGGSFDDFI